MRASYPLHNLCTESWYPTLFRPQINLVAGQAYSRLSSLIRSLTMAAVTLPGQSVWPALVLCCAVLLAREPKPKPLTPQPPHLKCPATLCIQMGDAFKRMEAGTYPARLTGIAFCAARMCRLGCAVGDWGLGLRVEGFCFFGFTFRGLRSTTRGSGAKCCCVLQVAKDP